MKLFRTIRNIVKKVDFFSTSQFFRYKGGQNYQSFFGGFVSIVVLIIIAVMFYDRISTCLARQNVSYTSEVRNSADPTRVNFSTYPIQTFMIAVGIQGFDLSSPSRNFFHISLINDFYISAHEDTGLEASEMNFYTMEKCTEQHWKGFGVGLPDKKSKINMDHMLCAPLNSNFSVRGKWVSTDQRELRVEIRECFTSPIKKKCSPYIQQIQYLARHYLKAQLFFTNVIVNPGSPDHLTYFLDDRTVSIFGKGKGEKTSLYIQDFTVVTDKSLHFFQDFQTQVGVTVEEDPFRNFYSKSSGESFVEFRFQKSTTSKTYNRSFEKVQDVLAFIGGLFGTFSSLLFLISAYNCSSYEISACSKLFKTNDENKDLSKRYNFFQFLKQSVHGWLQKIGLAKDWNSSKMFDKCQEEMNKNFDVVYFLQRILFLESAVSVVLDEHQVKGLHLREKIDIEEVKKKRESVKVGKSIQISLMKKKSLESAKQEDEKKMVIKQTNSFTIDKSGVEIESNQLSQNSSIYSFKNQNLEAKYEAMEHLSKIQKEASKGERISKRIMRLSGLMVGLNAPAIMEDSFETKGYDSEAEEKTYVEPFIQVQEKEKQPTQNFQDKQLNESKIDNMKDSGILEIFKLVDEKKYFTDIPTDEDNERQVNLLKPIQNFLRSFDFFSTNEFFRFKADLDHRTFFGGLISILMFVVLAVIFYQSLIDCLNKVNINATSEKIVSSDPPLLQISTYPIQNFMAFIMFETYDFSIQRSFDFQLKNTVTYYDEMSQQMETYSVSHKMELCTEKHIDWIPEAEKLKNMTNVLIGMCLPLNTTFSLRGKKTSEELHTLDIVIKRCTDEFDPSRPCPPRDEFSDYYGFDPNNYLFEQIMNFYISNPLIVPNSENYLSYLIDDRAFSYVSEQTGAEIEYYFEDYTITTDQSIYPFVQDIQESGGIYLKLPSISKYKRAETDDQIARIRFYKSPKSLKYYRSFQKIEDVVAFIGGLFGIFSSCLFLIVSYNTFAYEISIGSKLFKPPKRTDKDFFKNYNFVSFLKQTISDIVESFGMTPPKWKVVETYNSCQEEIQKQLDVIDLSERLIFLETAISVVLEEHETRALHLRQRLTLDDAKKQRKAFKLKRKIKKLKKEKNLSKNDEKNDNDEESMETGANFMREKGKMNSMFQEIQATETVSNVSPVPQFQRDKNEKRAKNEKKEKVSELQERLFKDEDFSAESSSSSDDSSEQGGDDKSKFFQEILKINEEAKKGHRISRRISELSRIPNLTLLQSQDSRRKESKVDAVSPQKLDQSVVIDDVELLEKSSPAESERIKSPLKKERNRRVSKFANQARAKSKIKKIPNENQI